MKLFQQIAFTLISSVVATGVVAEEIKQPFFSPTHISVASTKLTDDARDGCWTNLKQSREYLDEQLKLNGYEHVEDAGEYGYLTKAEWTFANRTFTKMPDEIPEHAGYAGYLAMLQKNYYEPTIQVIASRNEFGRCYGFVQVSFNRWVSSHHIERSYNVEVDYIRQIFMNADNTNGIVLDMSKKFVKHVKTRVNE